MQIFMACVIQEINQIIITVAMSLKNLLNSGCTSQRNCEAELIFTKL